MITRDPSSGEWIVSVRGFATRRFQADEYELALQTYHDLTAIVARRTKQL